MTTDLQQQLNMNTSSDYAYDPTKNTDKQWLSVNDNNQGSYNAGIVFELPNLRTKLCPFNEARLVGAISITSGTGSAFTNANFSAGNYMISFPFGIQGMFYGVSVKTSNGTQMLNNPDIPLRNYVESLETRVSSSLSDFENYHNFKADSGFPFQCTATLSNTSLLGPSNYYTASALPADGNIVYNYTNYSNSMKDSAYIQKIARYDTARNAIVIPFDIPLGLIDPFFNTMDFLLTNVGLELVFLTAFYGIGTTYKAIDFFDRTAIRGDAVDFLAPVVTIDTSNQFNIGSTCRLYYPYVIPQAAELVRISQLLNTGWVKNIEWLVPNVRLYQISAVTNGTTWSDTVVTSVVLPQKLHLLAVPSGAFSQKDNSATWATLRNVDGITATAWDYTFRQGMAAGNAIPVPFGKVQVEIDGKQYFTNVAQSFNESWELFKENLVDRGENELLSPYITMQDKHGYYRGLASYDISRLQERIQNPYAGVPIRLGLTFFPNSNYTPLSLAADIIPQTSGLTTGLAVASVNVDLYVIIERSQKVRLNISRANVDVTVGLNPDSYAPSSSTQRVTY